MSITSQAFKPNAKNTNEQPPADSLSALLNRTVQKAPVGVNTSHANHTPKAESNIELQLKSFTDRLEQNAQQTSQESNMPSAPATFQTQATSAANDGTTQQYTDTIANNEIEKMRKEMHLLNL